MHTSKGWGFAALAAAATLVGCASAPEPTGPASADPAAMPAAPAVEMAPTEMPIDTPSATPTVVDQPVTAVVPSPVSGDAGGPGADRASADGSASGEPASGEQAGDEQAGGDRAASDPVVLADPAVPTPDEAVGLGLAELEVVYERMRADIRSGDLQRARVRFESVEPHLDLALDDPRHTIATDLRLVGGYVRARLEPRDAMN